LIKTTTISWEFVAGDTHRVMYFLDDAPIGEDNEGFNRILDTLRTHINIRVILKIQSVSSLGGNSLIGSLPFRDRFNELREVVGENKLVYEFV
jgi:hypothetical protein